MALPGDVERPVKCSTAEQWNKLLPTSIQQPSGLEQTRAGAGLVNAQKGGESTQKAGASDKLPPGG